jgi:hypothetical protein
MVMSSGLAREDPFGGISAAAYPTNQRFPLRIHGVHVQTIDAVMFPRILCEVERKSVRVLHCNSCRQLYRGGFFVLCDRTRDRSMWDRDMCPH